MITSEKQLEDYLFNSDRSHIEDSGLYCFIHQQLFRQVNCDGYGIADLVSVTVFPRDERRLRRVLITIYELKLNEINKNTFFQALKYQKAIAIYCQRLGLKATIYEYSIVLIGRELDARDSFNYIPDFVPNVQFYTYSDTAQGIRFKGHHIPYFLQGETAPSLVKIKDRFLSNKKKGYYYDWLK